jgi:hypothetical protein
MKSRGLGGVPEVDHILTRLVGRPIHSAGFEKMTNREGENRQVGGVYEDRGICRIVGSDIQIREGVI